MQTEHTFSSRTVPVLIGIGALGVAAVLLNGALGLSSDVGYAGVGADFLPLLLAGLLAVCGLGLIFEALTGGFRRLDKDLFAISPSWSAFLYLSAALLLNALLISSMGFVLSCALAYAIAVRGLRCGQGLPAGTLRIFLRDFGIGLVLSAPVFWLFTKLLNVSLPSISILGIDTMGWM